LIADWQGTVPAGKVCRDLVNFTDFYATFAELAGAEPPEGLVLDSHSFAPQLLGRPGSPREWVYVQLGAKRYLRDPHWKLTADGDFSDMKEAPFRELPVPSGSSDPEAQAARQRLQAALDQLLAQDTGEFKSGRDSRKADKQPKEKRKRKRKQQ